MQQPIAIKHKQKSRKRKNLEIRMTEIWPFRALLWEKIIKRDAEMCRECQSVQQ